MRSKYRHSAIWKNGPFSHVTINVAQQTAKDLADYLDTLRIFS